MASDNNVGKLSHSHSSPSGVDQVGLYGNHATPIGSTSHPTMASTTIGPAKGGKMVDVRVQMLDDSISTFRVQVKAIARVLFDQVCKQLNLLESDYFGLEYEDSADNKYWLDLEKPVGRQMGLSLVNPLLRFAVKFYTPDPAQLEEEFTRYLFCLQIKRDLANGWLQCNDNTAALLASYIVQSECGDFVEDDYPDHTYLSTYKFVPHQDPDLEKRIMENHKKHVGHSPAEADFNLLETARRCELYGCRMHPAKDHEGVPLNLAVASMGILVFQNFTKINTFSWAKIRKLSFKRKKFLIKLHPEGYVSQTGYYKDTVEFVFDHRDACKNFWKKCVEHHGFFRCAFVKKEAKPKARVMARGSSFRYTGRTQKQVIEYVRENYVQRQSFQRSQSFRHTSPLHSAGVGTSISAQPLLPVADNVAGTPTSMSFVSHAQSGRHSSLPSPERTETVDVHEVTLTRGGSEEVGRGQLSTRSRSPSMGPSVTSSASAASSPQHSAPQPPQLQGYGSLPRMPSSGGRGNSNSAGENGGDKMEDIGIVQQAMNDNSMTQLAEPVNSDNDSAKSPPLSPLRSNANILDNNNCINPKNNNNEEIDARRKRHAGDKAYYIAKELLMTERTYKKDLEVLDLWFRDEISKEEGMPEEVLALLFAHIDPIYESHCLFLKDIEHRLAAWEGRGHSTLKSDYQRIGDIMLRTLNKLDVYSRYMEKHRVILEKIDQAYRRNKKFEQIYRDFETQKVCYLPLNTFMLKPLQRLLHYQLLLDRLISHYGPEHPDYSDCYEARCHLSQTTQQILQNLHISENFGKLVELQRDLVGIDNVVQMGREFLREGCLQKLSRKGFQQRMFFLFSDVLLYTNRAGGPCLQFKVHGQLPLRGVMVEDSDAKMGNAYCFTIYGGNRALLVAAHSQEEKDKWIEDLTQAIQAAKERGGDNKLHYLSLKSCSSSEEVLDKSYGSDEGTRPGSEKTTQQRSNTTVHVCWHRNTSVSFKDHLVSVENQLSGYLLRKFKNSNGWQKLWVVFTNFCLFFYKTFQDDFPLASLPLLGYSVTSPTEQDNIQKEFVFKLQFKNHVYFFRAESEYTFNRWMEVIGSATQHSGRLRLFSRKESEDAYWTEA